MDDIQELLHFSKRQQELASKKSERLILDLVKELMQKHKFILIKGLRGSGKTTLLRTLLKRNEVLMTSGDFLRLKNIPLEKVLKSAKIINAKHIFIDEIHHIPSWQLNLKVFVDWVGEEHSIIVTGSSALSLTRAGDIKRRAEIINLNSLTYLEFLNHLGYKVRDISSQLYKAIFLSKNLEEIYFKLIKIEHSLPIEKIYRYFKEFKQNPLPALFETKTKEERMRTIIYSVIEDDIPYLTDKLEARTLLKAKDILHYLSISEKISINKLSNLAGISKDSVTKLLHLLESAGILQTISSYGGNALKDQKKYVFTAPLMRKSVAYILENEGFEREDLFVKIVNSWRLPIYYNYKQDKGYDFVVNKHLFEIGGRSKHKKSNVIVVAEGGELSYSQNKLTIPLEMFALMEQTFHSSGKYF